MVIDFHTHCFPEKVAPKAMKALAENSGDAIPYHNGTVDSLIENIKQMGADMAVVLNIATNPKQQTNVNNYAIEINSLPEIISFGSVHPDSENALEELERIKEAGLKGIKLHPDYQGFFVDDEKTFPIYKKAAELGLITVFHSGVDIGLCEPNHCTAPRLKKILPLFEGAPVVAAHFGGYLLWNEFLEVLGGEDIYIDTAYAYGRIPPPWAKRLIDNHGADRVLFGSDMPWSRTDHEIRLIKCLGFDEETENKIFSGNAKRILGL